MPTRSSGANSWDWKSKSLPGHARESSASAPGAFLAAETRGLLDGCRGGGPPATTILGFAGGLAESSRNVDVDPDPTSVRSSETV